MPTLTVKNIPDDLYAHLREAASLNHRSLNSEIIVCLERALQSGKGHARQRRGFKGHRQGCTTLQPTLRLATLRNS